MTGSWDASGVRVHLVSWPDGKTVEAGLEVADWHLVAMRPVRAGDLERCLRGLERRPHSQLAFEWTAAGTDIWLRSTYRRDLPVPVRIGAAGSAWVAIDKEVGRLWTVNGEPKTLWSSFKAQRREMLERLTPLARQQWLGLALQRSEPLFAAVADVPSAVEDWSLSEGPDAMTRRWAELYELVHRSGARTTLRTTTGSLGLDDLASLFVQASREIARGGVDDLAAATEKIFEGRWVLDATYGSGASQSLAMVEDVAWFDDALQLASDPASAADLFARNLVHARQAQVFADERHLSADVGARLSDPADWPPDGIMQEGSKFWPIERP